MQPMRDEYPSHHDHLAAAGPAVDVHGRVVTAKRRAAARYRQAQRAAASRLATTALRLAVHADPAFGLAVADLDAITATASQGPGHQQMNWERHHIEVVRAAATGNARRAADLLREHLASIGCDPLAQLIETGKVTPVIGKTYPLHQAPDAMRDLEAGRARGKLVITVTEAG